MKSVFLIPLFMLFLLLTACEFGPNSGRGFSLPEGNADKGRATFVELHCNTCHSVADIEYIGCDDGPDINIELGGEVTVIKTYGDLVTSIINPSHKIVQRHSKQDVCDENDESRMVAYNDVMTVQQLVDLVTYLESNYQVVPANRTEYVRYRSIKDE